MTAFKQLKKQAVGWLRWSEYYTRTDMVYAARGGFWLLVGKAGLMLISIVTLMAFANWLPVEVYGQYQYVLAAMGLLGIFALPGLNTALTRSVARGFEGSLSVVFKTKFRWSLWAMAGLLAAAGWYFYHGNMPLAGAFTLAGLLTPLKLSAPAFGYFWQGRKRFDIKALYGVLTELVVAGAVIATLFWTDELAVLVAVFFGSSALSYGLAYYLTARQTANQRSEEGLVQYGKHLTLINALSLIAQHFDKILIWKLLGPVELAVYMFALKPIDKIKKATPISTLALPKLSEHGVKGIKRKKSVFRKFLLLLALSIPSAGVLALSAPFVYGLLFPQYMESVLYFQILCIIFYMLPFSVLSSSLVAEKKVKFMYIQKTVNPVIKILLLLILTPIYGLAGVMASTVVTLVVGSSLTVYFFWRM